MGGRGIQVTGLKELVRELKKIDGQLPKEVRRANFAVAKLVANEAQQRAGAGTPIQRKAASAIRASAGAGKASVSVRPSARIPFANGAFFGAKRWRQFEPWVGTGWAVGRPGEGPYAINPAIASLKDRIVDVYAEAIADVTTQAFPE